MRELWYLLMRKAGTFRQNYTFQVLTYTSLRAETTGMLPHLDCGVQGQLHPSSGAIPDTGPDERTKTNHFCVLAQEQTWQGQSGAEPCGP